MFYDIKVVHENFSFRRCERPLVILALTQLLRVSPLVFIKIFGCLPCGVHWLTTG